MNLPDFLCIGAQKCGTKWLQEVLEENPAAWLSPVRELNFFDRVGTGAKLGDKEGKFVNRRIRLEEKKGKAANKDYIAYLEKHKTFKAPSREWYDYVFSWSPTPGLVKGDITPGYLEMPEERVKSARELLGDKKIIVHVRSPLERELSQLRMWVERASKDDSAPKTTASWLEFYKTMITRRPHGNYKQGIPLWQKYFGADNVKIVPFADIRERPEELIKEIETFIGVKHFDKYTSLRTQVHQTEKVDIPAEVIEKCKEKVAPQVEFLVGTFGEEFFARTH